MSEISTVLQNIFTKNMGVGYYFVY